MPFVKLDCAILSSSIWFERLQRELFITALLMAEPHELLEETPQIKTHSLEHTGWIVPTGWYGLVRAAGIGIIHMAGIEDCDRMKGLDALAQLGEPDPDSRSKRFDGRRMVRVNGGYIILNYDVYRERDYSAAERMRRYRKRLKDRHGDGVTLRHVTLRNAETLRHVTQAEGEAEEDVFVSDKSDPNTTTPKSPSKGTCPRGSKSAQGSVVEPSDDFLEFWEEYPRKVAQKKAWEAWRKANPPLAQCLRALSKVKKTAQWQRGKEYIPHAATWINQERWDDDE